MGVGFVGADECVVEVGRASESNPLASGEDVFYITAGLQSSVGLTEWSRVFIQGK